MKKISIVIVLFFISQIYNVSAVLKCEYNDLSNIEPLTNDGKEYWALLISVGAYNENPDKTLPMMVEEVENLYDTLIISDTWDESHIKKITVEDATFFNILKGFKWLDDMEDEDDICLIYLASHGLSMMFDFPPFDEVDRRDEALVLYDGFRSDGSLNPFFGIITDDIINKNLNRLESKGVCIIVDSCHSGGFNDNWDNVKSYNYNFSYEFSAELATNNRIVLTSVHEQNLSWDAYFTSNIIDGMKGFNDENDDGLCSAEEIFNYASDIIVEKFALFYMRPQIFDYYQGELDLIDSKYPTLPIVNGDIIGHTNISRNFQIFSKDYDGDEIKYFIDWGDGSSEFTEFNPSNEPSYISHIWQEERPFYVQFKAIDENGLESNSLYNFITVINDNNLNYDQIQDNWDTAYWIRNNRWLAQSFIPSKNEISKVCVGLLVMRNTVIELAIREELNGDDLICISKEISPIQDTHIEWYSFEFDELSLTGGSEYFLICRGTENNNKILWCTSANGLCDLYINGAFYRSDDSGQSWEKRDDYFGYYDTCFITFSN